MHMHTQIFIEHLSSSVSEHRETRKSSPGSEDGMNKGPRAEIHNPWKEQLKMDLAGLDPKEGEGPRWIRGFWKRSTHSWDAGMSQVFRPPLKRDSSIFKYQESVIIWFLTSLSFDFLSTNGEIIPATSHGMW